jgi:hypothetical protein
MARLIEPRPDPNLSADRLAKVFVQRGFVDEAHALAAICRAAGLGAAGDLDHDLYEDHERVVAHVANEMFKLARPGSLPADAILLLAIHTLDRAASRHSFINWTPTEDFLAPAFDEWVKDRADLSVAVQAAFTVFKDGPVEIKPIVGELFTTGHLDPLKFIDAEAIRTTTKGTGGVSWSQPTRENDPRLPDFWFALDPVASFDAFRRLFEAEPIDTLGVLALGLERSLMLQYSGNPVARGSDQEIQMRELYPYLDPLAHVLCRRRSESMNNDRTLMRCCWSYSRLTGERAPELLGELYEPLARLALAELENLRKVLRSPDAEAFLNNEADLLTEAVFFGPRTDPTALWPVLRRLVLALREVPHRGVPLDLRTWDEHEASFERVPRPWNWVVDHIARVLELLIGRELERDSELAELRYEFAKFCIERVKTREKARADRPLANEDFFEPKPEWRAAYINAAKELHLNVGGRGHHALTWSRDHDPDEDVRDAARSAAEVLRHGHGLPKNTSPRRAMFAAFWWLRQAHVVSLGERVDEEGAQRTFRKEMRRQADLKK